MIISIGGKVSDLSYLVAKEAGVDHDGYVPYIKGIGGGDYIEIEIDNDTGKIVGWVPLTVEELREKVAEA